MTLRRRITLLSASAVAVAVVLASVLTYVLVRNQLHGQVDAQLRGREVRALRLIGGLRSVGIVNFAAPPGSGRAAGSSGRAFGGGRPGFLPQIPLRAGDVRGYSQVVLASGRVIAPRDSPMLPVGTQVRSLARLGGRAFFSYAIVSGVQLRVFDRPILTADGSPAAALQLALPLTDVNHTLSHLRLLLVVIDGGVIALAALLASIVARTGIAPVRRLIAATERIAQTHDLSERIPTRGSDELGRLALSFNAMLDELQGAMGALDASVRAQRQLVADASHELRTPITSLRTNIELLEKAGDLDAAERARLLGDLVGQVEELTLLVNDLIDLARGEGAVEEAEELRLDEVVRAAAANMRRYAGGRSIVVDAEPTVVRGVPQRLNRAVTNLLDNAIKWSPPDGTIEVGVHDGALRVRDHGPGIDPADLPHVFDRFYRGAEARGRPGSGLGLAIVRQVAETHGGSVGAEAAPGGGTLMTLRLPAPPLGSYG